jgi:uncharacterized protein (TIGR03435 family)
MPFVYGPRFAPRGHERFAVVSIPNMDRKSRCVALFLLLVEVAFDQSPKPSPAFDTAEVHTSAPIDTVLEGGVFRGGRYQLRAATMLDMIGIAYNIDADLVFGGPGWLESDRFDVIAEAPPATPAETIGLMLQSLLAERFGLAVHKGVRPTAGFVLKLGNGKSNLKMSSGPDDTGCRQAPVNPDSPMIPGQALSCHNITMEAFASVLRPLAEDYLSGPVVDRTGIKGNWDFDIRWTGRKALRLAGAAGITIFDAFDRQLGLKLEPQMVPMAGIVVDKVNEMPTANPSGVTTALPPPEFEVASLKPSLPGAPRARSRFFPGGRVEMHGLPLALMIKVAWNVDDEEIPGSPKWLGPFEPAFDLFAKAPLTSTIDGAKLFYDDYRLMLRALLQDRFKMVTHYEDRPVTAYSLVRVKPRLRPADRSNRSGCKSALAQAAPDSGSGPVPVVVTCKNMTMAQFSQRLQTIAPVYLHNSVLDATGIVGAWDFSFTFSPIPPENPGEGSSRSGRSAGVSPGGDTVPSAANGDSTLFEAVSKQLGLKLMARKRLEPVFVIDRIEPNPTDN